MSIVADAAAIAKGMSITFKEMFQPTEVENYPDGKGPMRGAKFQERFRGKHQLQRDENGLEKCVACFLCAAACPSNCIYIEAAENTEESASPPPSATPRSTTSTTTAVSSAATVSRPAPPTPSPTATDSNLPASTPPPSSCERTTCSSHIPRSLTSCSPTRIRPKSSPEQRLKLHRIFAVPTASNADAPKCAHPCILIHGASAQGDRTSYQALHDKAHQHPLEKILQSRIAIIDGAMGTTIRTYGMTEADIRGERFKNSTKDLLNNGDIFSLTQPKMICDIHRRFLEAGADIIETNTFGATSITQSEFFVDDPREHGGRKDPEFYQKIIDDPLLSSLAWEINEQSARQCREWADRVGERNRPATLRGRCDRSADRISIKLARCGRCRLPGRHLRSGQDRLHGTGARSYRRRLRPASSRDDLRLAQRQGGTSRHP